MGNQHSKKSKEPTSVNSDSSEGEFNASRHFAGSNEDKIKLEVNRLQKQHYLFKYAFQTSYFAPIEEILKQNTANVLEIRHGLNPCWMNDIANDFPNCKVTGIDLVDPYCPLPANCSTLKAEIYSHFPFPDNSMDYTHQRMFFVLCPRQSVDTIFKEILRITKPNGWIEMMEPEIIPRSVGPLFSKLMAEVRILFRNSLNGTALTGSLKKKFNEIGLVNIKTDYASLPICWGGFIGKSMYDDMLSIFRYLGPMLYDHLGIAGDGEEEQYEKFIDSAFDECVEYSTYIDVHWTIGQKPANKQHI